MWGRRTYTASPSMVSAWNSQPEGTQEVELELGGTTDHAWRWRRRWWWWWRWWWCWWRWWWRWRKRRRCT